MNEERKSLRCKLRLAMAEMSNPKKNVSAYKYNYAQLDQVLEIIRPALQRQEADIRWSMQYIDGQYIQSLVVFDDYSDMVLDQRPFVFEHDPQENGKVESYQRRYAAQSAFALASEDDDAQGAHKKASNAGGNQKHAGVTRSQKKAAESPSVMQRIEAGKKKLFSISPWTDETLEPLIGNMPPEEQLQWLIDAYNESISQMRHEC